MRDTGAWVDGAERAVATWPLLIVAVVGIAILLVLVNGPRLFRGSRPVIESFWCPVRKEAVRVEFEIAAWDAARLDVNACSAFDPPTAVTCDKRCLEPKPRSSLPPLPAA